VIYGVGPYAPNPTLSAIQVFTIRLVTVSRSPAVGFVASKGLVLLATLSGLFGAVAILLTATGPYGLLAYTVAQRTQEIGVRMAVGATARAVTALVLKRVLVGGGLLFGVPIAIWTKRFAATMVENLSTDSFIPIVAAVIATIVMTLLAAWVPARRATRVDPLVALRSE